MSKLIIEMSMSLDGFVAGPRPTLEKPLGEGGEQLHQWLFAVQAFRERHGLEGGETSPDSAFVTRMSSAGATVMGRRMFSGGAGPWEDDPNAASWFGEEPPFGHPVFIVTHFARVPVAKANGTSYTFVTTGVEDAVARAHAAAGERDVVLGGGGETARQALAAGLVDELHLHLVPILLGGGVRLFDGATTEPSFERLQAVESPSGVTHLDYRVARSSNSRVMTSGSTGSISAAV